MSTIELPDAVAARLRAEAARRGMSMEELLTDLADGLPATRPDDRPSSLGFIGIGASTGERGGRDADEMLAEGFGRR